MKAMLKKTFSAALSLLLAANVFSEGISAASDSEDAISERIEAIGDSPSEVEIEALIREYADTVLPSYMIGILDPVTFEMMLGKFYITDIIPQHDWETGEKSNRYMMFVSKDNVMVGQLVLDFSGENVNSSFYHVNSPEVNEVILSGEPFQIGFGNEMFLLLKNGVLMNGDTGEPVSTPENYKVDYSEMTAANYDYAVVNVSQTYSKTEKLESGALVTHSDTEAVVTYLDEASRSGWVMKNGEEYYIKPDGTMATKNMTIAGIRYKFDKHGVCQGKYTGWTKSSSGRRYYLNGKPLAGKWFRVKGKRYYADENGYAVTGEAVIDGKQYYFDEKGVWDGKDYSDTVESPDLHVEMFELMTIEAGKTLMVKNGEALTVNGSLYIENGGSLIIEDGSLVIGNGGSVASEGVLSISEKSDIFLDNNSVLLGGKQSEIIIDGSLTVGSDNGFSALCLGTYKGSYDEIGTDILAAVSFEEASFISVYYENYKTYTKKEVMEILPEEFIPLEDQTNPAGALFTYLNVFTDNGRTFTFRFRGKGISDAPDLGMGALKFYLM